MNETVTINFDPPRTVKQVRRSYILEADHQPELMLPIELTTLHTIQTPDGERVESVTIPRFIALDRGLVDEAIPAAETDSMSRYDWFLLGMTMAMVISGKSESDALWDAKKMADKLMEMSSER